MIFRYSQQTSQLVGFTIASEYSELWYHIGGTIHYSTGVYQAEGKNKIFFPLQHPAHPQLLISDFGSTWMVNIVNLY